MAKLRQRPRDAIPHRIIRAERAEQASAEFCRNRVAGGKAFDAVTVVGTGAKPGIPDQSRNADVAELGVAVSMNALAIDDQAHPDAGADRDIGKIFEPRPCTPAPLGQRGAINVGIEGRRNAGRPREPAANISPRPMWFWCRGNVAEVIRTKIKLDWSKTRNAKTGYNVGSPPLRHHMLDGAKRLLRNRSRNHNALDDGIRRVRQNADALGPAKFNASDQRRGHLPLPICDV